MNGSMYENPIVQKNIRELLDLVPFYGADTGLMAAEGEYGKGRLPQPEVIVEKIKKFYCR